MLMKAVMLMFDSLNRHMLPVYGCNWVKAPNFSRLAERTVVFDSFYVGSMPCMPARRELHTGRYNFLHRSWGPLECFDDSMPEILKNNGISTHLISDHYHYWEEGGANYHTRYSTWQAERGQEGDFWISDRNTPDIPYTGGTTRGEVRHRQDWVNRAYMKEENDYPQARTVAGGIRFLEQNHDYDNWFLHIETFDPHEPYFVPERYKALYPEYDFAAAEAKGLNDWPDYRPAGEADREQSEYYRYLNAALISMCDHYLGKVMEAFDRYDLWKDTMLIVNTDHGFLLGEHDWWAKCAMPFWQEIAHTPFFLYDPREKIQGERRNALAQTIDIAPTLLNYFNVPVPEDVQGRDLNAVVKNDSRIHDGALFGIFGGHVNVTDGRWIYMRAPSKEENKPLFNYTHMPAHMKRCFSVDEMRTTELHPGFSFTKGCPVMKIDPDPKKESSGVIKTRPQDFGTLLYDVIEDPQQQEPVDNEAKEKEMKSLLVKLMKESDAPPEQYERLELEAD
jgi:arylsulfatase A-like enzyme